MFGFFKKRLGRKDRQQSIDIFYEGVERIERASLSEQRLVGNGVNFAKSLIMSNYSSIECFCNASVQEKVSILDKLQALESNLLKRGDPAGAGITLCKLLLLELSYHGKESVHVNGMMQKIEKFGGVSDDLPNSLSDAMKNPLMKRLSE